MNLGKENHDSKDAEQLKMVLETKEICLQKLNNENVILRRENKRLKNEKTTLEKEKATSEKEKAAFETKKVDTVSLVWSKAQSPLNEASWSSEKQKEFDSLKIQLDKLENYNEVVLKAKNDQKKDNSKLRERIQHIQRDFEKKANAFDRLSGEMQETKEEIGHLLKENKRVLHIYEKLKEKQRNEMVIEEHICKLKNEIQDKDEKVRDLSLKLEERTTDTRKLNDLLQSNKQERVKEKKMYLEEIFTLNKGLENLRVEIKQKESTRNRLSKLAGQKLMEENPSITDLCKPNRPAEIGERWASLYSDEWTDVFEEMIQKNEKMENKDETPEKQLLKIVDWCYKKCTEIFNSQNTLIYEKVWELVSILHRSGVKEITLKKNQRINAYDQKGKENAVLMEASESFLQNAKEQQQCSSTLVDSVKKKCFDDYGSLNQTTSMTEKKFIRKCSELCWYMISSDPPMAIEYENIENKSMDSNKFNKYNRTGTIVEYVVWPVLLLHIDGPVLAKGSVQTNIEPKIGRLVARKKSAESVIAPPLACRTISSDEHVIYTNIQ